MHTTEERAARWLLMTADRVGSLRFPLTQEFLAQMLGVRRATVSLTAGLLQSAGLISYRRGNISITDRAGLEDVACTATTPFGPSSNDFAKADTPESPESGRGAASLIRNIYRWNPQ